MRGALLAAALGASLALLVAGCDDPCGNEIVQEVASPDGKVSAVLFQRDCGATTSFSSQISILRRGEQLPPEAGNVFIADDDHGKAETGPWDGPWVALQWTSPHDLQITHARGAGVYKSESSFMDVNVTYRAGAMR